jgi:CheY-like chemotaxis protein
VPVSHHQADMNGCAVPSTPAVLVTAVPDTREIDAALRAGEVQNVLGKPWSPLALLREAIALVPPVP